MTGHLLSIGHGYSAQSLGRRLLARGWTVTGTSRNAEKCETLRGGGLEMVQWPGSDLAEALGRADHLLVSVAPDDEGDPVIRALGPAIAARTGALKWVGYLSTTAVYGDHGGGWVDEDTPVSPTTRRGKLRAAAEAQWRDLAETADLPLSIFRLAGIYGPGRGPLAKVRAGTARQIIRKGQVFGRIHVEDIATVLEASIRQPERTGIYNVTDDLPAPPEDVLAFAADLLGVELPPPVDFEAADMTPMARSFYAESKRVRNDRIKDVLGVKLAYPDYRSGLRALADGD